jgi:hypothetical protein
MFVLVDDSFFRTQAVRNAYLYSMLRAQNTELLLQWNSYCVLFVLIAVITLLDGRTLNCRTLHKLSV